MATTHYTESSTTPKLVLDHEDEEEVEKEFEHLVSALPTERGWITRYLHEYQGFWYSTPCLKGILSLQKYFQAQTGDILLVTYPKSGTTWLKALIFTIVNRKNFHDLENPLLKANPHELVTVLEIYASKNPKDPRPPPVASASVLMMNTHMAFTSLPDSIKTSSDCRIVYVFRDPKDVLVSCWHFVSKIKKEEEFQPISLAEAYEQFSRGASPYGPYWDHVMGYWKASLEFPEKFLFLSYEELKKDPFFHVKILAEFLGHGFSTEEVEAGEISKIVEFCSFEKLSNLDVNKSGTHLSFKEIENKIFFRQGKVGDAKNHLSEEMMLIMDGITKEKFKNMNITTVRSHKDESETTSVASDSLTSVAAAVGPSIICACTMNAV